MTDRGLFIVLEGVEGVGKTTQWKRIGERLRDVGHSVVSLREPGGTDGGDLIRNIVLHSDIKLSGAGEALLFAASRAEIIAGVIQPALARGDTVLLDRFLLSTYAYQGAGRGLEMKSLRSINEFATRGITPDLTLLLSLPVHDALQRAGRRSQADRIERENHQFHERVAAAFDLAATKSWQDAHPECGRITPVDASGSPDEVSQRCIATLAERWPSHFGTLLESATR